MTQEPISSADAGPIPNRDSAPFSHHGRARHGHLRVHADHVAPGHDGQPTSHTAAGKRWTRTATAILIIALLLLPLIVHNTYFLHVMIVIAINVIMAVSMWLLG